MKIKNLKQLTIAPKRYSEYLNLYDKFMVRKTFRSYTSHFVEHDVTMNIVMIYALYHYSDIFFEMITNTITVQFKNVYKSR